MSDTFTPVAIDSTTNVLYSVFGAATERDVVEFGFSLDSDANTTVYYDRTSGFWRFGPTSNITPQVPWQYQVSSAGISYNVNVQMALEKNGSPYFGFGGSTTGSAGFIWATSADNLRARFD